MFKGGLRVKSTLAANGDIRIGKSLSRRLIYGGSFVVCLIMFIVGFDFGNDLSASRLPGTLIILLMAIGSLYVAGFERRLEIKAQAAQVHIKKLFFGFLLQNAGPFGLEGVAVMQVVLYRRPENIRGPALLPRRDRVLHRLFLYHTNGSILVDESRDGEDLLEIGRGIAEQNGIKFEVKTL